MYVYIKSEPGLWTVGFYTPSHEWMPDSDHASPEEAAAQVSYLNGGIRPELDKIISKVLARYLVKTLTDR